MNNPTRNPATALRQSAQALPDLPAIIFADQSLSYSQLLALTEAFALRLRAMNVGPGATVHLDSRDVALIAPTLLATALLGACFLQNVGGIDQPGVPTVTHALAGPDASARPYPVVTIGPDWSPARTRSEGLMWDPGWDAQDPGAPLLIVYTSGTTGMPKFLTLSQGMVAGRSAAVADEFRAGETRLAALFPPDSRPYLARLMAVLWSRATLIAAPTPELWNAFGVTRVSGSLGQARRLFANHVLSPRLSVIEVSGARLEAADAALLLRSFDCVDDTYGATETNKTFSHFNTLSTDGQIVSTPAPRDSTIQILRDDGSLAAPGEEGEVRIQNPYMATGYLNAPDASARAFRDGWFHPGDRGLFGADGTLTIRPRAGAFVNSGGAKVGLQAIDGVLASVDGIVAAVAFPSPKAGAEGVMLAFAVFDDDVNRPQVVARARAVCTEVLGADLTPAVIRPIDHLPRLADGTPDRDACAKMIMEAAARSGPSRPG